MAVKYRTRKGDMLDHVAWKHYKKQSGAVEEILEANPGLAEYGEQFPAGLVITLPDIVLPESKEIIRLWN
ncbi:MAG: phage tail protein [Alphaproteobacteria bacterium CG11_big_fil_rev_8_21_14_0_20_39_49]|nr:MAG: phage tail protein [Alphaproteobacteria bacterium CG11_big_fil_rev_8_21_14_0_20_39_49]